MNFEAFVQSTRGGQPPQGVSVPLRALWHEARGDWDRAHRLVQEAGGADAAWVHAYLHRREGDLANARYWYARAGRSPSDAPLETEWAEIVRELLASGPG